MIGVLTSTYTMLMCYSASTCPNQNLHVTGNGYEMNHSGCVNYKTKQNVSVKCMQIAKVAYIQQAIAGLKQLT